MQNADAASGAAAPTTMSALRTPQGLDTPEVQSPRGSNASLPFTPALRLNVPTGVGLSGSWAVSPSPNRSGSMPASARALPSGASVGAPAKVMQESALLTAVRRQMEALEDKLSGQIQRVQQQGDRLRDAAFSRVDSKMGMVESLQPRLDRRIAELCGSYKGLSDEMQSQIRRIDNMDSRIWEWRHQLDEEIRTKFAELEQGLQQATSMQRVAKAANEDLMKRYNQRLLRLEGLAEERVAQAEEITQNLVHFHSRLTEVEEMRVQDMSIVASREIQAPPPPVDDFAAADRALVAQLQGQLLDVLQRMDYWQQESNELRTKAEAQEERTRSLRTLYETKDEQYRQLVERLDRENLDARLREFASRMQDAEKTRQEQAEKLEILSQRLDGQEQANEELLSNVRRISDRGVIALSAPDLADAHEAPSVSELHPAGGDALQSEAQFRELEARLEALSATLDSMRADLELAPRVSALVVQLKDVAPKVIHQEALVKQLSEKVSHVQAELELDSSRARDVAKTLESLDARLGKLEFEVGRLVNEVEGDQEEGSPRTPAAPSSTAQAVVASAVLNVLRRASQDGDQSAAAMVAAGFPAAQPAPSPSAGFRTGRRASATE